MTKKRFETIAGIVALIMIASAFYIGSKKVDADIMQQIKDICQLQNIQKLDANIYTGSDNQGDSLIDVYIILNSASGYGGDLIVATLISSQAQIIDTKIISHKETNSFFKKVLRRNFPMQFIEKPLTDSFLPGDDIDAISGATFTCRAYSESVRKSVIQAGNELFGLELEEKDELSIVFGKYEWVWLIFLIVGVISIKIKTKRTKLIRWIILLSSMLVLGFIYNIQFSIGFVNKALLGFFPSLSHQFYFYIVLVGVFLIILITNKNVYCDRICPFGATQECLSAISGTDRKLPKSIRSVLIWIQRLLALGIILAALITQKPDYANYEVFSTMFRLTGGNLSFILLLIFLLTSLVIKRPWCDYACPVKPVTDFTRMIRSWIFSGFGNKTNS